MILHATHRRQRFFCAVGEKQRLRDAQRRHKPCARHTSARCRRCRALFFEHDLRRTRLIRAEPLQDRWSR